MHNLHFQAPTAKHFSIYGILILMFSFISYGASPPSRTFSNQDSSYHFSFAVPTQLHPNTLYQFLMSDASSRAFISGADTVICTPVNNLQTDVEVHYHSLSFKAVSKYRKSAIPPDTVRMDLLVFENNWPSLPKPQTLEVLYSVSRNGKGCILHYSQKAKLDKKIGNIQLRFLTNQLNNFAKNVSKKIREMERNVTPSR